MCDAGLAEDSQIDGNPLAAGANLSADIYWAQFLYKGAGYYMKSVNLSQEEFIRILHSFYNK